MPQYLIFLLLILALILPVLGAAALRIVAPRLDARQFFGGAAVIFAIAILSVLVLSRSNVESLQIGNLTLLLPLSAPDIDDLDLPPDIQDAIDQTPVITDTAQPELVSSPTVSVTATLPATATTLPTATLTPTVELTPTATIAPTATLTPTVEATPTTPPPPPAEPTAPPPPPQPRTYTVQPGDTLRSIAAQFNVSVADLLRVNNLTPAQADALRVGAVLTIP